MGVSRDQCATDFLQILSTKTSHPTIGGKNCTFAFSYLLLAFQAKRPLKTQQVQQTEKNTHTRTHRTISPNSLSLLPKVVNLPTFLWLSRLTCSLGVSAHSLTFQGLLGPESLAVENDPKSGTLWASWIKHKLISPSKPRFWDHSVQHLLEKGPLPSSQHWGGLCWRQGLGEPWIIEGIRVGFFCRQDSLSQGKAGVLVGRGCIRLPHGGIFSLSCVQTHSWA